MNKENWWRNATIYQVYPKSFSDSNGDGYGDFPGLLTRLPYIADLGVDAIWLTPFFRSPENDGGYDVADYRAVDPKYGTLADFQAVIEGCHALGLKVIVDIVPNHCSSDHEWFQSALQTQPPSEEWERFHVLPGLGENGELPPNNWQSVTSGSAWSPILQQGEPTGYWYLHIFDYTQPDLNWNHPEVRADFESTLRFWFERGVDGFRIDVAHGLFKAEGYPDAEGEIRVEDEAGNLLDVTPMPYWDQAEVHEIYRSWREIAEEYSPERIFVAEAWVPTAERLSKYLRNDELHTGFNFGFMMAGWQAAGLRDNIEYSIQESVRTGAPTTWVLDNHDTVRCVTRWGTGWTSVWPERGVSHDDPRSGWYLPTEEELALGRQRSRASILTMLGLPGTVYLWQGQELGLEEVRDLPAHERQAPEYLRNGGEVAGRDGCRVPIPWTRDGDTFGFAPDGAKSWLTQPRHWDALSVEAQSADVESMLNFAKEAVHLRRSTPELLAGAWRWRDDLAGGRDDVLVYERTSGEQTAICATNFSKVPLVIPAEKLLLASSPTLKCQDGFVSIGIDTSAWLS